MGNDKKINKRKFIQGQSNQKSTLFKENKSQTKNNYINKNGEVVQSLGNGNFKVILDDIGKEIICNISGKIRMNYIKILVGDLVEIELSVYDLTKGRIIKRLR